MWQACSRVGMFATLALVACSSGGAGKGPRPDRLEAGRLDPSGEYWCSIDDADFTGPRYACVIKKVGARLLLGKLTGSERIRGEVTPADDGFLFSGEIYCPWGDCQQALHGKFKPTGSGNYTGTFREDPTIVRLMPAPKGSFGGAAYGGDQYGDPFGYPSKAADAPD